MSKDCSTKNAQRSTFLFVFVRKTQSAISSPVPYSDIPSSTLSCRLSSPLHTLFCSLMVPDGPCVFQYITNFLQFLKPTPSASTRTTAVGKSRENCRYGEFHGVLCTRWRYRRREAGIYICWQQQLGSLHTGSRHFINLVPSIAAYGCLSTGWAQELADLLLQNLRQTVKLQAHM